ncbi:MAG: ROK family protein [Planctomycetota bacterium]
MGRRASEAVRIGLDVGGTHLRVGLVRGATLVWQRRRKVDLARRLDAGDPQAARVTVLDALGEGILEALAVAGEVEGIGVGFPGFLDPSTGVLHESPSLPGLRNVNVSGVLSERLARDVLVENDALCGAAGERLLHPARPPSLVYVGLGTGVGGGAILEGRPLRGAHGVAMEIGHLVVEPGGRPCACGQQGCPETYASATGVRRGYEEATGEVLESEEIAARARRGDAAATAAFDRVAQTLARALAHVTTTLDVEDVCIGGGLSGAWDLCVKEFRRRFESDLLPFLRGRVHVRLSESGDRAGMIGAAWLAGA